MMFAWHLQVFYPFSSLNFLHEFFNFVCRQYFGDISTLDFLSASLSSLCYNILSGNSAEFVMCGLAGK